MAFTQNIYPTFPKQPQVGSVAITAAETTTLQTLITPGANGCKVIGIICVSNDTAGKDLVINRVTVAPVTYVMATITIPLSSGFVDAVPPVNCLLPASFPGLPVDNDGNPFFYLISGDTLQVNALATLTAAKSFFVTCFYTDF